MVGHETSAPTRKPYLNKPSANGVDERHPDNDSQQKTHQTPHVSEPLAGGRLLLSRGQCMRRLCPRGCEGCGSICPKQICEGRVAAKVSVLRVGGGLGVWLPEQVRPHVVNWRCPGEQGRVCLYAIDLARITAVGGMAGLWKKKIIRVRFKDFTRRKFYLT